MAKLTKSDIGGLGEDIACRYLEKKDFSILDRNYLKKWGEIDIVARETGGGLCFVEVKSVSCEISPQEDKISRVTSESYRAEENVHPHKLKRLRRVIQSYLLEKGIESEDWRFHVLVVELDVARKAARCRFLKDIVL